MKSLFYLNKYFIKYRWRFLMGILFIIVSNIFAIYPAQVIRVALDMVSDSLAQYQLLSNTPASGSYQVLLGRTILIFGVVVLVLALAKGLFLFFTRQTIIVMSRLIEYDLKNEIYDHYQSLDLAFFKKNSTGDLMNRISEDVSRVRMYLGPAVMYTMNLIVLFILVIGVMLTVSPLLTFYVLLPLPLLSLSIYYVSNIINVKSERVQKHLSGLSTFVQESFAGIRVLKAFTLEQERTQDFSEASSKYKEVSLDLARVNALFMPLMILLIGVSTIITVYVGGRLTITGEVTTGNIAEFVIYVNMLTWPVAALGWVTSITQRAAASQKRINEFLNQSSEIIGGDSNIKIESGEIEWKNVSFKYPDSEVFALENISFKLKAGESLAITGRTGSGKSTIAQLLLRLYDITEGSIRIDEHDIKEYKLSNLRRAMGYVPQDAFLFSNTVRSNIEFGLETQNPRLDVLKKAADDSDILNTIQEFEKEWETKLGERGVNLSGGQKQRMSMARAFAKQPVVLILDDSLSAVDTETEDRILRNLDRLMKGRTTIVISHRISSLKQSDNVLVLEEGQVIQSGDHQSLIKQEGLYKQLYEQQQLEQQMQE
ncbi:MAG TPA: ABC transporter [Flavobacteriales bacterium]|nr:ABC transporter [Flavobacteriales bacterium]